MDITVNIQTRETYMLKKKIALASLFVLLSILACQSPFPASGDSSRPADIYLDLRTVWFQTKPEDLGITPDPASKVPFAVVMDMGVDGGTTTLGSSIVGDGSLLISTGGGFVGGVEHENVRNASIHFVELSGGFVDRLQLTTELGLPLPGYVKFYVITPGGVYTTGEVSTDTLAGGTHEFSPLFLAGNEVITQIRIASENQ